MTEPAGQHLVRFYDRDDQVRTALVDFVAAGLARRDHIVLLATRAHWDAVCAHSSLREQAQYAIDAGTLTFIDADALRRDITRRGRVDVTRFSTRLKPVIASARAPLRVFGEVVSLLAADGDLDAAVEIEQVGHELAHDAGAHVMCAYRARDVLLHDDGAARITRCHDGADGAAAVDGEKMVVLLADDFEDGRELYREYLEFKGYRVITAADGVEAVERARAVPPALILLDIQMPRMTGSEAMLELKRDPLFSRVPIVALTAHALDGERDTFLAQGFDAVIAKPCLPEDLVVTIGRLLAARSRT